jgi:hypothetical protein
MSDTKGMTRCNFSAFEDSDSNDNSDVNVLSSPRSQSEAGGNSGKMQFNFSVELGKNRERFLGFSWDNSSRPLSCRSKSLKQSANQHARQESSGAQEILPEDQKRYERERSASQETKET